MTQPAFAPAVRSAIAASLLALSVSLSAPALAHAQQRPADPPTLQEPAAPGAESSANGAGDGWNFEEEEEAVPTYWESARTQAPDILMFAAFVALAMVSFFKKSEPLKLVTLGASVLYMGIYKSQLISIVNIFGLLTWNLPIVRYSLGWYAFAIFTFASTIFWGRLYCGRVCAFGSMTQLLDQVVPKRLRVEVPKTIERRAGYIKYGILAAAVAYYFVSGDNVGPTRVVEPFWMFAGHGTTAMWVGLAVLLTATIFIRNLYCRFLCPVGAFLGVLSSLTVFRIKRWSECTNCRICEKTCEWGAIRKGKIIKSECVRCDDCERLYYDKKKCPHWLIIQRKADIMARQSAVPSYSGGS